MNTCCTCEKRHPCTSTVWRQLTDWREQVTTWRDLRGLLYSHSDTVCLLIQSNCIELQLSINILIWVAWLFDCYVDWSMLKKVRGVFRRTSYPVVVSCFSLKLCYWVLRIDSSPEWRMADQSVYPVLSRAVLVNNANVTEGSTAPIILRLSTHELRLAILVYYVFLNPETNIKLFVLLRQYYMKYFLNKGCRSWWSL
jgi:hypothetical protein